MSKNLCPLCGNEKEENVEFCSDCREIAQNQYLEDSFAEPERKISEDDLIEALDEAEEKESLPDNSTTDKYSSTAYVPRKRASRMPFIFITILLLLLVVGIGSAYYYKQLKATEGDLLCWIDTTNDGSELAYSKYLLKYPNGRFSAEAKEKLLATHHPPKAKQSKQETPQPPKVEETPPAAESPKADKQTESTANQSNEVSADELNKLKTKLKGVASLFSLQRYTELKTKHILPTLFIYHGEKDKAFNVVVNELIADRNKQQIKEITYTLKPASVKAERKGAKGYTISGDYEYMIVYKNSKKSRVVKTESFKLDINDEGLIEAIYK